MTQGDRRFNKQLVDKALEEILTPTLKNIKSQIADDLWKGLYEEE